MGDAQPILDEPLELDISHIQIEDGEPVDNIFSEKQMRLLTESLYASWRDEQGAPRVFAAFANVGLFYALKEPPVVPDVMVALDVVSRPDPSDKKTLSYFIWEYGKPPDIAVEIVSNKEGGEDTTKMQRYAQIGVAYYAIYDPDFKLSKRALRVFERHGNAYVEFLDPSWLPRLGLGMCIWSGHYENTDGLWLRWVSDKKRMLATGAEALALAREEADRAQSEVQQAQSEVQRAQEDARRAQAATRVATEQAEKLAARLRELGLE